MQVELVVTCTDRKTVEVPQQLRFRHLLKVRPVDRLARWTQLLEQTNAPVLAAQDLYAGDHWAVVKSTVGLGASGFRVRPWVCSAGYGLVPWDAELKPYSATFSSSHTDSVGTAGFTATDWWEVLKPWRPGGVGGPRGLADLAASCPESFLLLCLSGPYLRAAARDLRALRYQRTIETCGIICAGLRQRSEFGALMLPADARWKTTLGGAMQSLNARVARWAIRNYSEWQGEGRILHRWLAASLSALAPLPVPSRKRTSDGEVRAWIEHELAVEPGTSVSLLLRRLRDSGHACEQGRFRGLFKSVTSRSATV